MVLSSKITQECLVKVLGTKCREGAQKTQYISLDEDLKGKKCAERATLRKAMTLESRE